MHKIFINPGHGGNDTGAVGNGLIEPTLFPIRRATSYL